MEVVRCRAWPEAVATARRRHPQASSPIPERRRTGNGCTVAPPCPCAGADSVAFGIFSHVDAGCTGTSRPSSPEIRIGLVLCNKRVLDPRLGVPRTGHVAQIPPPARRPGHSRTFRQHVDDDIVSGSCRSRVHACARRRRRPPGRRESCTACTDNRHCRHTRQAHAGGMCDSVWTTMSRAVDVAHVLLDRRPVSDSGCRRLLAVCIVAAGLPAAAYAQAAPETQRAGDTAVDAGVLTGRPVVRPPRLAEPPVIDGRLDEPLWRDAAHITELVQRRPFDGTPASEPSDIYLAYDSANIYVGLYAHYSNPGMIRANRRDRDESIDDDLFLIYFDPFLDQQRAYVFTVNGYGVQGDAILQAGALGGGPLRRAARRRLLGRAVRLGGRAGRRRLCRRAGDPLQEPPLSAPRGGGAAPLGAADRAHHRRARRGGRLVTHLARHRRFPAPDGRAGGDDGPVAQPQPGAAADLHDDPLRFARSRDRPVPGPGPVSRGGPQPEVRGHVQPHRGRHVQSRLLAGRVGPAADRGQPALRALLPGAAPVLPGGRRDLRRPRADHGRPHPADRRSRVRRQAHRQGRADQRGRAVRQRRGARQPGRSDGPGVRVVGRHVRRPGALRPVRGVARRNHLHQPGAARRPQPARRRRLELSSGRHPLGRVPRDGVPTTRTGRA